MILQLMPRMNSAELKAELDAMDRGFEKLMARPDGAKRLLEEIGMLRPRRKPKASLRS
jgi:hypothetical protein